ncbi:MAG: GGDEF domain-containing protein [Candidatus Cloacimonetes bacterium]|nr:GGDEF domain-containing protein [Candidatus Cloacimonadota bacterium]
MDREDTYLVLNTDGVVKYTLIAVLVIAILFLIAFNNYLMFYSIVEMFSIVFAFCIFILTWNARNLIKNQYILFMGVAFFFIGSLDLLHMLSYKGMSVFPNTGSNLSTQLWIASRYVEAITFALAPVFIKKRLKPFFQLLIYSLAFLLIMLSIFSWQIFPDCFINNSGLTSFSLISEYAISLIFVLAIFLLYRHRKKFTSYIYRLLIAALILMIIAELSFTFYIDIYDISNFAGYIFRMISIFLIFLALAKTGFKDPYRAIFKKLRESRRELKKMAHRDTLTVTYNRHYLYEYIDRELERSTRYHRRLALAMIDIDRLSPLTGDRVLKEIGDILLKSVRKPDSVIRYGGDEFLILLPETGSKVEKVVKRLKEKLAAWNQETNLIDFPLKLSFGISYYDPEVHDKSQIHELLSQAYSAMYENKDN